MPNLTVRACRRVQEKIGFRVCAVAKDVQQMPEAKGGGKRTLVCLVYEGDQGRVEKVDTALRDLPDHP